MGPIQNGRLLKDKIHHLGPPSLQADLLYRSPGARVQCHFELDPS